MSYTSEAALRKRYTDEAFLQLTDRDGDDVADADVVAAAIAQADALIDSYLGVRYALPLEEVDPVINGDALAIAWYFLHPGQVPKDVQDGYAAAVDHLKQIANGKAEIAVANQPTSFGISTSHTEDDRTFTAETLSGWY